MDGGIQSYVKYFFGMLLDQWFLEGGYQQMGISTIPSIVLKNTDPISSQKSNVKVYTNFVVFHTYFTKY